MTEQEIQEKLNVESLKLNYAKTPEEKVKLNVRIKKLKLQKEQAVLVKRIKALG